MKPEGPGPGATWVASQSAISQLGQSSGAEQEVAFPDAPPQARREVMKSMECAGQASREPALSPVQ